MIWRFPKSWWYPKKTSSYGDPPWFRKPVGSSRTTKRAGHMMWSRPQSGGFSARTNISRCWKKSNWQAAVMCHAILYYDIYIYIWYTIYDIWYMIYDIWYHAICSMVLEYVPTVSYYVILGVNVGKYFIHGAFRYRIWYIYRDTSILYVTCYDIWLLIYPIYRYMSRTMIHIYSIQCGKDVW